MRLCAEHASFRLEATADRYNLLAMLQCSNSSRSVRKPNLGVRRYHIGKTIELHQEQ